MFARMTTTALAMAATWLLAALAVGQTPAGPPEPPPPPPALGPEGTPVPAPPEPPPQAPAPETPQEPPAAAPVEVPATQPAPHPAIVPVVIPASRPGATAAVPTSLPADGATVRFQFENENLRDLVRYFVPKVAGKPIMGNPAEVTGTFTYVDTRPYTPEDAMTIINHVLRMNGFTLVDKGRYLELIRAKLVLNDVPIIELGLGQEIEGRDDEIVTVILPLKYIDPDQAMTVIARMVNANFGMLSKLGKGQGILIADTVGNIRRIQRILSAVDKGTMVEQQMKSVVLQHASAEQVARLVREVSGAGAQRAQRWVFDQRQNRYVPAPPEPGEILQVAFDARCNMVILVGPAEKLALAEELIAKVDVERGKGEEGAVRIFELTNAKAEDLAKTISAALPPQTVTDERGRTQTGPAARIVADGQTNRLLVAAAPAVMKQVEDLVTKLDAAAVTTGGGVRTFPLKTANAVSLVDVVRNTFARQDRQGRMTVEFSVSADARTNTLIVSAPGAEMERIAKLVEELDRPLQGDEGREIHVVRLQAGDARQLGDALRRLLAERPSAAGGRGGAARPTDDTGPRIEADGGTNSLLVSCAPGDWQRIKDLIEQLKTDVVPELTATTRVFPVQHAKADELVATLQQIFDPRRRRRPAQGQPEPVPVVIAYNSQSNAIVASAGGEDMTEVDRIVKMLDVPAPEEAKVEVRTYSLTGTNAVEVARMLQRLFTSQQPSGRGQRPGTTTVPEPKFEGEPNSNQLVVVATTEQFNVIDGLIQKVQKVIIETSETTVRLFPLKHARADTIVEAVRKVVESHVASLDRNAQNRQRRTDYQVSADARTNTLLVTAPADTLAVVEKLLPSLDAEDVQQAQVTKIIELSNADPSELADAVNTALGGQPPRGGGRNVDWTSLAGKRVFATPAASARALLLTGSQEDVAAAEEIVRQLDERPGLVQAAVKTFPLKHAKAEEIARVLNDTVAQTAGAGSRGRPAVPARISADRNANAVVVSAAGDVLDRVEELIKQLDVPEMMTEAVTIEIVHLQHAKADAVATALNGAQPGQPGSGRPGRGGTTEGDVLRVTPDAASNNVLLTGRRTQIDEAKKLIADMDLASREGEAITKLVQLENADAAEVADALNAALAGQAAPAARRGGPSVPLSGLAGRRINVVAAPNARAVLLTGGREDVAFAEELVARLDERPTESKPVARTFPIRHNKAEEIARVLNETLGRAGGTRGPGRTDVAVRVSADKAANAVVVTAGGEAMAQIERIITDLDVPESAGGETRTEIVKLINAKAEQMAAALNTAQGADTRRRPGEEDTDLVRVTAEPVSNTLLLTGKVNRIAETRKLIEELDKGGMLTVQMRIFPLKFAKAAELVPVLTTILQEPAAGRGPRGQPSTAAPEVRIASQDKANAVVVHAPPDLMALAEQIIKEFDREGAAGSVIEVVRLARAEAVSLAEAVNQALSEQPAPGPGRRPTGAVPETAVVVPEVNSNSLLVRGPKREVERALLLIRSLDEGGEGRGAQVRVFALQNADALTASKTLETLFKQITAQQQRQAAGTKGPPAPSFSIAADERTNSLIVSTSPAYLAIVEGLLKDMDAGGDLAARDLQYIPLIHADAWSIASQIDAMFEGRPRGDRPSVTADFYTNCLAVVAKDADLKTIEETAAKLDEAARKTYSRVKVIPLAPGVRAEAMAETLRRVYGQVSGSDVKVNEVTPGTGRGGEGLFYPLVDDGSTPATAPARGVTIQPTTRPGTAAPVSQPAPTAADGGPTVLPTGQDQPPVIITVDKGSNSLIVSADRLEMERIQSLIDQLTNTVISADAELRVFKVKNADVTMVAVTLDALFNPRPIAGQQQAQQAQPGQRGGRQQGQAAQQPGQPQPAQPGRQGQAQALAQFLQPKITIAADVRTRSVIVRGKPTDLDMIDALIKQLDEAPDEPNEVRVFVLKNTDAEEVAANLREMFAATYAPGAARTQRQRQPGQAAQPAAAAPALVQPLRRMVELREEEGLTQVDLSSAVTISANRATNSLVVTAPSAVMALVAHLVGELDQQADPTARVVRMFHLKQAEVSEVVEAVSRIFATPTGRTPAGARAAGAVVTGNESGRMVIVAARQEDFALIEQVIQELDTVGGEQAAVLRVYRLEHADARSVADALSQTLLGTGGGAAAGGRAPRTGAGGGASGAMRISAETTGNAVIVRASEADHQRVAQLISELDREPQAQATFTVIKLQRTDAQEVANALTRMVNAWPVTKNEPKPSVGYDRASNTLMVSGAQRHMDQIKAMVEQLEAGGKGPAGVQMIPLTYAKADEVARALSQFYGQRASPGAGAAERTVTIAADARTNTLLVSAPPEEFTKIAALVGKMDVERGAGELQKTVIALKVADADMVARAITQAYAPPRGAQTDPTEAVVASAEPGTNSVVVSASEKNLQSIRALIAQLDVQTEGGRKVDYIVLENARAADVAKALSDVVSKRARTGGGAEPPSLSAEPSSNIIVIAGAKTDLDMLKEMAGQMDKVSVGKQAEPTILALKNADAVLVADMVNRLLRDSRQPQQRAAQPVAVSADVGSNSVVVVAPATELESITRLVNQIDEMSPGKANLRLIQLKNANAKDVLDAIQRVYGSGGTPRVGRTGGGAAAGGTGAAPARSGGVQASALPEQRALLINASDEDWKVIEKLIQSLDEAADIKREVLVFPLDKAPNIQVAATLTVTFRAIQRPNRPEDIVSITPLAGTNAVVVVASKENMEKVSALIKQLDGLEIAGEMQFKVYPLVNASAIKVLPLLRQMIQPLQQSRPQQPITLTADEPANAIIVTTQAPIFEQIEQIIKRLDQVPAFKEAEIVIIPLKKADAVALASVLTDALTPGTSRVLSPEARALQEQIRLLRLQKGREDLPPLDLTKPIKITSDPVLSGQPGSNSLVISSTPENLKAMAEIVSLLDTLPLAAGVRLQVVHLKNADAVSVMTLLREVFTQGRQLAGRPGTSVAGRAQPDTLTGEALTGVLNITADARTNAVVIAGSEESVALAMLIVKDLDTTPAGEFTEVRAFKLANADANNLAPVIRAALAEGPVPTGAAGVAGARAYVTRLRMLREKQQPVQSEIARSHPTLIVQPEANANLLLVLARSDLMDIVAEMVRVMDIPGAGSMNVVRIYPLTNADATRMMQVVTGLYTGANANLVRAEDRPTITVDTRTNSLVVSTSEKTFAVIDALLVKLDAKLPPELLDIRLVPLANADAAAVGSALQRLMDARVQREIARGNRDAEAMRMVIIPDARTNFLLVGGTAEGFKIVEDLARQLDAAPAALAGKVQLISLTNANAGTLSSTLTTLFDRRYQAVTDPALQRQRPVIIPDLRTNMLLVAANQDDSLVIQELVGKLDAHPTTPAVELVVVPMKFNDAGSVGPMIQQIFADRLRSMTPPGQVQNPQDIVTVVTDGLSNSLVISASKDNLAMIRDLLGKVDVEPPVETGVVRMYVLQHTDATRVAGMLRSLVQQGFYKPGLISAVNTAIVQAREKVSIEVDVRTNVLIISASKENFAVLEEIIKKVDSEEAWGLAANLKMYPLKNANALNLATTLQQMFDRKRAAEIATGGEARSLAVVIVADERTNALLVAASKETFETIDALLDKLDTSDILQTHQFAIFPLKNATAATLAPIVRQLFAARIARGTPLTPLTVLPDAKTNSLIIGGDKSDLVVAEDFIRRLDVSPPKIGMILRVFPLAKADAATLAATLQRVYADAAGAVSGVIISVDDRSNALLVTAGGGDMENIADLIAKLDATPVTDVTEIRIFTLQRALASQLATVLTAALTNKPVAMTPVSPNRATLLRFIGETADGRRLMASALKEGVMITAVDRTNSLLVQAPVDTMPLLASLIDALDNTAPQVAEIHVFTLSNADATQLAQVLSQLFQLQLAPASRQAAQYTVASPTGSGEPVGEAASAQFGSAEQSALTITVDRRTNSLLVGGTRAHVELVGRVIRELDASPAEDRQTVVYRMRHARATDIEAALRDFLDQENQRVLSALGADAVGSAKELLAREIAIKAEPTSNSLLISGSPRYFKTIAAMVRELDRPAPQVLIQVLLAEVTLDDTIDLGVEWTHTGYPDKYTTNTRTSFGVAASTTGLTFSVTGGDLLPLVRALQAQGRLEVLSRPEITATDNLPANLNIGQSVPFVTSSRITDTGTVNTIEYRPVGIILNVTPYIGCDGFVRLLVAPEISSVTESTVKISENVNALIIDSRSAETTVTVQDGHTIVIGGLITKKQQNREDKVPLLGDLPMVGQLFKSTRIIQARTELLIILTPRIIRAPSDADVLTNQQVRQMNLSRGVQTEMAVGELLNPLRGVTPLEVKRLEQGLPATTQPVERVEPLVIPMTTRQRDWEIFQRLKDENR